MIKLKLRYLICDIYTNMTGEGNEGQIQVTNNKRSTMFNLPLAYNSEKKLNSEYAPGQAP